MVSFFQAHVGKENLDEGSKYNDEDDSADDDNEVGDDSHEVEEKEKYDKQPMDNKRNKSADILSHFLLV